MKIRQGFVSNSSSASYIVTLHKKFDSIESLLNDIYENCWCAVNEQEENYFNQQALYEFRYPRDRRTTIMDTPLTRMLQKIDSEAPVRERIATRTDNDDINYHEDKDTRVDIMRRFLAYEGIEISLTGNHTYQLKTWTSMHNSFNDMNNLLKNIYFEYLANQGGATFQWESDN